MKNILDLASDTSLTRSQKKLSAKDWTTIRIASKDTILGVATFRTTKRNTLLVKEIVITNFSSRAYEIAQMSILEFLVTQSYWNNSQGQIEFESEDIPYCILHYAEINDIDLECPEIGILTPRDTKLLYLSLMAFSSSVREVLMEYESGNRLNVEDVCFLISKGVYSVLEIEMLILSGFQPEQVIYGNLNFTDVTSLFALQATSYGMFVRKFIESISVKVTEDPEGTIRSYEEPFWDVKSWYDDTHRVVYCHHLEENVIRSKILGDLWKPGVLLAIKPLLLVTQTHLPEILEQILKEVQESITVLKGNPEQQLSQFSRIQPIIIVPKDFPDDLVRVYEDVIVLKVPVWERVISAQALQRSFSGPIRLGEFSQKTSSISGMVLVEFYREDDTELKNRVKEHINKLNHPEMRAENIRTQANHTLRFVEAYKLEIPVVESFLVKAEVILGMTQALQHDKELQTYWAYGILPPDLVDRMIILQSTLCKGDAFDFMSKIACSKGLGIAFKPILALGGDKKPSRPSSSSLLDIEGFTNCLPEETMIPLDISPEEQCWRSVETALKQNRPALVQSSHIPLTQALHKYAYGEIPGKNQLQFIFPDKTRSVSKPIARRSVGASDPDNWENWYPIKLGFVSIRHMEMDRLVHLYICSNRVVSNAKYSSAVVENYAYENLMNIILQTVPQEGVHEPIKLELYHTGLEPVTIGIYRAVIDLLNSGRKMVVIPMLHPSKNGSCVQGDLWF